MQSGIQEQVWNSRWTRMSGFRVGQKNLLFYTWSFSPPSLSFLLSSCPLHPSPYLPPTPFAQPFQTCSQQLLPLLMEMDQTRSECLGHSEVEDLVHSSVLPSVLLRQACCPHGFCSPAVCIGHSWLTQQGLGWAGSLASAPWSSGLASLRTFLFACYQVCSLGTTYFFYFVSS